MFIQQIGIGQSVQIVRIEPSELSKVVEVCETHRLDFDDGYQYVAAELNDLRLVSFDADFDRTPRGRLTAAAALRLFTDEQKNELQA